MNTLSIRQAEVMLARESWYAQGGAVKGLYISYPWSACLHMTMFSKLLPVRYKLALYMHDNIMEDYITRPSMERVSRIYAQRYMRDPRFLKRLLAYWHEKKVPEFLAVHNTIMREHVTNMSESALQKAFKKLTHAYLALWYESIFLDGFDTSGETFLHETLQRSNRLGIPTSDLDVLVTPPQPTLLQQERLRILALAEKILQSKGARRVVQNGESYSLCCAQFPWIRTDAESLSASYYWAHNDYAVIAHRPPSDFFALARQLVTAKTKLDQERHMRTSLRTLDVQKKEIIRKQKIPKEIIAMTHLLAVLGNFRDWRKGYSQMANVSIKKLVTELHRRTGTPLETLEQMLYWEIAAGRYRDTTTIRIAKNRQKGTFYITHSERTYSAWGGASGKKLFLRVKESVKKQSTLSGKTAFPGKVQGVVRLIITKSDFAKMQSGDILVSPNTRPEFVPVMRLAGAIVTEEGGITSHAAIVSRELRVPCIVGVQAATSLLHEGDLVEVDAEQGMVRKV